MSTGAIANGVKAAATAVTKPAAASLADDVAKLAAAGGDEAAKTVLVAAKGPLTGASWLGFGAGAAGLAITLLDAWKESVGSQKSLTAGALVTKPTMTIGGGAAMLAIAEKMAASNAKLGLGMRVSGSVLVLGGLVGSIMGAYRTFNKEKDEVVPSTQSQAPMRYRTTLPSAPENMVGIEVASADVIGEGRKLERVPVRLDPQSAKALPDVKDLGTAIGHARAASQSDSEFRSHAVVQTEDGAYWVMRLSGQLDQVDGPNYTKDNKFDTRYEPQIERYEQAIQAIAGVERHYAFPEGMEPTAPVQYSDEIPWFKPTIPGAKPATGAGSTTTTTASTTTAAATATPSTTGTGN